MIFNKKKGSIKESARKDIFDIQRNYLREERTFFILEQGLIKDYVTEKQITFK